MTDHSHTHSEIIRIARIELSGPEFDVWLTKHIAGKGRRSGSLTLGITEDAYRYRLHQATLKIHAALQRRDAA